MYWKLCAHPRKSTRYYLINSYVPFICVLPEREGNKTVGGGDFKSPSEKVIFIALITLYGSLRTQTYFPAVASLRRKKKREATAGNASAFAG